MRWANRPYLYYLLFPHPINALKKNGAKISVALHRPTSRERERPETPPVEPGAYQ
jgi:hypothetical protein